MKVSRGNDGLPSPNAPPLKEFSAALMLAAATFALVSRTADAKDLAAVSGFVAPAYMAMNLAAICSGERGWHAAQPRGARGVAVQYAEHFKDEAIDSLTLDEARIVLRLAANAARAQAREELHRLLSSARETHAAAVAAWCNGYVQEYIVSFIHDHDDGHDRFLQQLEQAKR